jgi:translation initiation factor IF-3
VIDEKGGNLGVLKLQEALKMAEERGLDLIEIAPTATPPVAKIISFDKFRYQKEKEEKKQNQAVRGKDLKHVQITPRAAANDLQIKVGRLEEFLNEGRKVEINLRLRGREKQNKEWSMKKLNEFLQMIKVPYKVTMEPRFFGKGYSVQIDKK